MRKGTVIRRSPHFHVHRAWVELSGKQYRPQKSVGLSVKGSVQRARLLPSRGADWGAITERTPSREDAPDCGCKSLSSKGLEDGAEVATGLGVDESLGVEEASAEGVGTGAGGGVGAGTG